MAIDKRCPNCSVVISKGNKYCHHCGQKLPQDINERNHNAGSSSLRSKRVLKLVRVLSWVYSVLL